MRKQPFAAASLIALSLGVFAAPIEASAAELPIALPWAPVQNEVAATCAVPAAVPAGKTWYVDPVNGTDNGNGSEATPWNSLSKLVTQGYISTMPSYWNGHATVKVMANAPIHPGDVILLKSGDYGKIKIQGDYTGATYGFNNSDFITIQAAPGATPVLDELYLIGGGKWAFRGLTIENLKPNLDATTGPNFSAPLVNFAQRHHDIILDNNTIGAKFPVTNWTEAQFLTNWTQQDWLALAPSGIQDINAGSCVTITNNTIRNVDTGLQTQRSNNVLIKGNVIDYFDHDGMDYGSSNLVIQHNLETNHLDAGDITAIHPDFMQGQVFGCTGTGQNCDTITNVLIDSNIVIRQTDPELPFAALSNANGVDGVAQGIDAFDGIWNNLRVTNNIVVTTAYQGISYYGVHDAVIANNILLSDGNSPTMIPVLTVQNQKNGTVSSNVVIRNNIASGLSYALDTVNAAEDHNICIPTNGKCTLELTLNGKEEWYGHPGIYGDHNMIDLNSASAMFDNFTTSNGVVTGFNLHAKAGTLAVGMGDIADVPALDITGATRTAPVDLGAYKYVAEKPFNGTIKIQANARPSNPMPQLVAMVDGQIVGRATVTANDGLGQMATYSFDFTTPAHPQTLELTLDGYTDTDQKYVSLNVFSVTFGAASDKRLPALKLMTGNVQAGDATLSPTSGLAFKTNGSAIQFNVSEDN